MMTVDEIEIVEASWPVGSVVASRVRAFTTTRVGGFSQAPYDSLNLGLHSGDDPALVKRNRAHLDGALALPGEPRWLTQTHGTNVSDSLANDRNGEFDAAWTDQSNDVLAVLTADCLPVVVASQSTAEVAVAHAGWRGLADGVLQATIARFDTSPNDLVCWLGPAIGPAKFEVGEEVKAAFLSVLPGSTTEAAFVPGVREGKWLANLYELAKIALASSGVASVSGGGFCTFEDKRRFHSYRRDGSRSGRMATLVWIT